MADVPRVNGIDYDYASIEVQADGQIFISISSVNYKHTCTPGKTRGTHAQAVGRTTGEYEASGSIELSKSAARELRAQLGPGYMTKPFDIIVNYAPAGYTPGAGVRKAGEQARVPTCREEAAGEEPRGAGRALPQLRRVPKSRGDGSPVRQVSCAVRSNCRRHRDGCVWRRGGSSKKTVELWKRGKEDIGVAAQSIMDFRDGRGNASAQAGAMLIAEGLMYIQVLARAWGAK
jgi:hypothetical protein